MIKGIIDTEKVERDLRSIAWEDSSYSTLWCVGDEHIFVYNEDGEIEDGTYCICGKEIWNFEIARKEEIKLAIDCLINNKILSEDGSILDYSWFKNK